MLNIDKLRYTYEKPFLDFMEGMERKVDIVIHIELFGIRMMVGILNMMKKMVIFWCQYDRVWSFLKPIIHLSILILN